jgi:hypothetical protein
MSFYRLPPPNDNTGVLFSPSGAQRVTFAAAPPPAPSGAVVPALEAEYVDGAGVRHTLAVVDGVTTISGVAPFLVQFKAAGTRAPTAFAAQSAVTDPEIYAAWYVGNRMSYGEGSGTWTYPTGTSHPRNEDTGPPEFAHIYRTAGTHTARLRVRDVLGNEATIACSVVVSAAPAATHIPVAAGAWPTWANNTRYTLQAGGDYRSFGNIDTGGRHNIIIEKTGSGADPRIGNFNPDGRSKFSAVAAAEYRAAHIRLVNIDVESFSEGQRGFDYVGIIGGLVRSMSLGAQAFFWTEGSDIVRSNVRINRGLFLEDTVIQNTAATNGFVIFGETKGFHARNTQFRHMVNGPTTWLMLRLYGADHTFRNCFWFSEANGGGANGLPLGQFCIVAPVTETAIPWRSDDRVGPLGSSTRYAYISDYSVVHNCQVYAAGSFLTNGTATVGSEGGLSGSDRIRPRLMFWEDAVFHPAGDTALSLNTASVRAQGGAWRNVRKDMGAGAYVPADTAQPNAETGDTTTFAGPKLLETVNSRPVTTPF